MSENIFAEIYNRILGLFGQSAQKEESKNDAVNRLRLVLMQDRTNLTPELLQRMRKELIELLSKYVELDKEALELNFEQEGEQMALMLSIPVVRAKDESEIEEALKNESESESEEEDNEEDNDETNEDLEDNTDEVKEEDSEDSGDAKEQNSTEESESAQKSDSNPEGNATQKSDTDENSENETKETKTKKTKKSE